MPSVAASLSWKEFAFVQSKLGWVCLLFAIAHDIFYGWPYFFTTTCYLPPTFNARIRTENFDYSYVYYYSIGMVKTILNLLLSDWKFHHTRITCKCTRLYWVQSKVPSSVLGHGFVLLIYIKIRSMNHTWFDCTVSSCFMPSFWFQLVATGVIQK